MTVPSKFVEAQIEAQLALFAQPEAAGKIDLRPIVLAVLRAIREPDEGMRAAGEAVGDYPWDGSKPNRIFTAMINHLLSEGEG